MEHRVSKREKLWNKWKRKVQDRFRFHQKWIKHLKRLLQIVIENQVTRSILNKVKLGLKLTIRHITSKETNQIHFRETIQKFNLVISNNNNSPIH